MVCDAFPYIVHNVIKESVIGEGGAFLYLNGYLASLAFDFLHKVSGFAYKAHKLGYYFTAGSAFVIRVFG